MYVRNPKKVKKQHSPWKKLKLGNSLKQYAMYDIPKTVYVKKVKEIDQDKSDISSMYDLCDLDEECEDVVESYLCEMNENAYEDYLCEKYDSYEKYVVSDDAVYPYIDTTWMNVERNG